MRCPDSERLGKNFATRTDLTDYVIHFTRSSSFFDPVTKAYLGFKRPIEVLLGDSRRWFPSAHLRSSNQSDEQYRRRTQYAGLALPFALPSKRCRRPFNPEVRRAGIPGVALRTTRKSTCTQPVVDR